MDKVFVVLCKYEGCEECSADSHLVGVYRSEERAREEQRKHDAEWKERHLHYASSYVYPMAVEAA